MAFFKENEFYIDGIHCMAAPLGIKVYDPGQIPAGGLNSIQNWLTKRGKDSTSKQPF